MWITFSLTFDIHSIVGCKNTDMPLLQCYHHFTSPRCCECIIMANVFEAAPYTQPSAQVIVLSFLLAVRGRKQHGEWISCPFNTLPCSYHLARARKKTVHSFDPRCQVLTVSLFFILPLSLLPSGLPFSPSQTLPSLPLRTVSSCLMSLRYPRWKDQEGQRDRPSTPTGWVVWMWRPWWWRTGRCWKNTAGTTSQPTSSQSWTWWEVGGEGKEAVACKVLDNKGWKIHLLYCSVHLKSGCSSSSSI